MIGKLAIFLPVFAALVLAAAPSGAKTLFADNSLSVLRGHDYEVGDPKRTVFTYEHFSAHTWGDVFVFIDRLQSDDGDGETYMEVSPRLSLASFESGFVKSFGLSTTAEVGDGFTHLLGGGAVDVNVPGLRFLQLNFYRRINQDQADSWQFTPVWAAGVSLGKAELLYDGFIDWYTKNSDREGEFNWTSQLKINVGSLAGLKKRIYVGVEYVFWLNKFGIRDVDEKNLNALVKYHF